MPMKIKRVTQRDMVVKGDGEDDVVAQQGLDCHNGGLLGPVPGAVGQNFQRGRPAHPQ